MTIHIAKNGQRYGSYPLEEVNAKLASGELLPTDLAWRDGMEAWAPLGTLEGVSTSNPGEVPPPPTGECFHAGPSSR